MAENNRVKQVRMVEAISKAELSRLSGLSERTIYRAEQGLMPISQTTKAKIIKALNSLSDKKREYTIDYLFPAENI